MPGAQDHAAVALGHLDDGVAEGQPQPDVVERLEHVHPAARVAPLSAPRVSPGASVTVARRSLPDHSPGASSKRCGAGVSQWIAVIDSHPCGSRSRSSRASRHACHSACEVADPADLAVLDDVRTPQPEPLGDAGRGRVVGVDVRDEPRYAGGRSTARHRAGGLGGQPAALVGGEITQAISAESPTTVAWT